MSDKQPHREENARFKLCDGLISRNINVPTFALEMMNPREPTAMNSPDRSPNAVTRARAGGTKNSADARRATAITCVEGLACHAPASPLLAL